MEHVEPLHDALPFVVLQWWPHEPQSFGSVMFVSQPSPGLALQSALPAGQIDSPQRLPKQYGVPPPCATHAFPQLWQCSTVFVRFVSQPFASSLSQSPKPERQAKVQSPFVHVPAPFADAQRWPQPPQLAGSVATFFSQPSSVRPLQSAQPASQAPMPHAPPLHIDAACAKSHALSHVPQCRASEPSCASQPSAGSPLQSAKPPSQPATPHLLASHFCEAWSSAQTLAQLPQCCGSSVVIVSQPFWGLASQSPKPGLQPESLHTLFAHVASAFGNTPSQEAPQLPQFCASFVVSASQPFERTSSQFWKVPLHLARVQLPMLHPASALGKAHSVLQSPQWAGSLCVFVSQPLPLAMLLSQLAQPARQLWKTHPPSRQSHVVD